MSQTFYTWGPEDHAHFTAFAKTNAFGSDLYKTILAPRLGCQYMYVETWKRGRGGRLPSDCTGNTGVNNILQMTLLGREYKWTQDRSKWAVTENGVLCVADLNRMESQFNRGNQCSQ